jgi:hypothetical protein
MVPVAIAILADDSRAIRIRRKACPRREVVKRVEIVT